MCLPFTHPSQQVHQSELSGTSKSHPILLYFFNTIKAGICKIWLSDQTHDFVNKNLINIFYWKTTTLIYFFFCLFRATPAANGGFQARGPIGVELPAYITATPDPSSVCDLRHRSWHLQILNPLSEARDQTCLLMDASRVRYHCATMGIPTLMYLCSINGSFVIAAGWVAVK